MRQASIAEVIGVALCNQFNKVLSDPLPETLVGLMGAPPAQLIKQALEN